MERTGFFAPNKSIRLVALITGLILLVPAVAMQFSDGVKWTALDFVTAGVLLFATGLVLDFAWRKVSDTVHRVAIVLLILAAFAYIWAELAVGIFTNFGS